MNGGRAAAIAHGSAWATPAVAGNPVAACTLMLLRLGSRWFAIDVRAIEEVSLKGEITRVPTSPAHILGVTSLRGRLITVVGLAQMVAGEGALSREGAVTLPRLVVVRDGEYEIAVVAESIGGMVDHGGVVDPDARRPACTFAREEIEWQGNRVCVLDVPALIGEVARMAGILAPADREDV